MKGGRLKPENLRSWLRPLRVLYDVLVPRNWYKKYTKTYICKILYKIRNIKQIIFNKYATNLKTTIFQRSLRNSGVLLLLLRPMAVQYYCHVLPSVSRIQYTALSLEGVLVTWYWRIPYIYTFGKILIQFYVNFFRQIHQIDVLQVSCNSWDS